MYKILTFNCKILDLEEYLGIDIFSSKLICIKL